MRQTVLHCLCFVLVSCSRAPTMSVVEVTPSEVALAQLPTTVSIRGQGFAQTVSLSLDDEQRASVSEPVVVLGETAMPVVDHTEPEELRVWVEGLSPGSYDLRIGTGGSQTVIRDAFRVLGAESSSDVIAVSGATSVANSSVPNNDESSANVTSETSIGEESATSLESVATSGAAPSDGLDDSNSSPSSTDASDGGDDRVSANLVPTDTVDASTNQSSGAAATLEAGVCVTSTRLFFDDYESGDLDAWTSYDTSGSCQTSGIESDFSVSGDQAFQADITCDNGDDHENYAALQFNGDAVRSSFSNSGAGIDAPHGIVIDFWARAQFDFEVDDGEWVSFLLLSGTCDWSDDVFSVGTGNATSYLAVSHATIDGGTISPFAQAETFPKGTWTKITAYVNYHTSTFVVWQDGVPITEANFVRPGTTLCHVRIGAYISAATSDAQVVIDDPTIWKLSADLASFDSAPCMTSD
jgi:hypothetical protein